MNSYLTIDKNREILISKIEEKILTLDDSLVEIDICEVDDYVDVSCITISLPCAGWYDGNGPYYDECDKIVDYIQDDLKVVTDGLSFFDAQAEGYDCDGYWCINIYWDDEAYDDEKPGDWIINYDSNIRYHNENLGYWKENLEDDYYDAVDKTKW